MKASMHKSPVGSITETMEWKSEKFPGKYSKQPNKRSPIEITEPRAVKKKDTETSKQTSSAVCTNRKCHKCEVT